MGLRDRIEGVCSGPGTSHVGDHMPI
jgi:hypothetical protein